MRHGRKSKRVRFDGHKGEIVADADSGVIVDISVKPGNAHDAEGSLDAIERAEQTVQEAWADAPVEAPAEDAPTEDAPGADEAGIAQSVGDCAYGTAANRRAFLDAGRDLLAKQPALHNGGRFTKEDFPRDPATGARTCPAGHTVMPHQHTVHWRGETVVVPFYRWPAAVCAQCPQAAHCLAPPKRAGAPRPRGRTLSEHPEETLLAHARAQQHTPEFHAAYRERQTAEHRLARLMQLGARQARYFGRAKTELQWLLAATVANLTLAAGLEQARKAAHLLGAALYALLSHITQAIRSLAMWPLPAPCRGTPANLCPCDIPPLSQNRPFWPDL